MEFDDNASPPEAQDTAGLGQCGPGGIQRMSLLRSAEHRALAAPPLVESARKAGPRRKPGSAGCFGDVEPPVASPPDHQEPGAGGP